MIPSLESFITAGNDNNNAAAETQAPRKRVSSSLPPPPSFLSKHQFNNYTTPNTASASAGNHLPSQRHRLSARNRRGSKLQKSPAIPSSGTKGHKKRTWTHAARNHTRHSQSFKQHNTKPRIQRRYSSSAVPFNPLEHAQDTKTSKQKKRKSSASGKSNGIHPSLNASNTGKQKKISSSFVNKLRHAEWISSLSQYKLEAMRVQDEEIELGFLKQEGGNEQNGTKRLGITPSSRRHHSSSVAASLARNGRIKDAHQRKRSNTLEDQYAVADIDTYEKMSGAYRPHYVRASSTTGTTGRTVMDQYLDQLHLKRLINEQEELKRRRRASVMLYEPDQHVTGNGEESITNGHETSNGYHKSTFYNRSGVSGMNRVSNRQRISKYKEYELHTIDEENQDDGSASQGTSDTGEAESSRMSVHSIVAPNVVLKRNSDIPVRRNLKSASSARPSSQFPSQLDRFEVGYEEQAASLPSTARRKRSSTSHSTTRRPSKRKSPLQIPMPVLQLGESLPESPHSPRSTTYGSPRTPRRSNHFANVSPDSFVEISSPTNRGRVRGANSSSLHSPPHQSTPPHFSPRPAPRRRYRTSDSSSDHHKHRLVKAPKLSMVKMTEVQLLKEDENQRNAISKSTRSRHSSRRPRRKRASTTHGHSIRSFHGSSDQNIDAPQILHRKKSRKSKKKQKHPPKHQEIQLRVAPEDQLLSGWNLNLSGDGLPLSPQHHRSPHVSHFEEE